MGVSQTAARLLGRLAEAGVLLEQPGDNASCKATPYDSRAPALFLITNNTIRTEKDYAP
jgi:hypothetical protein